MPKISALPAMPKPAVYRRANGGVYLKLNTDWHVKAKLSDDNRAWLGDGTAEKIDPDEQVKIIQQ